MGTHNISNIIYGGIDGTVTTFAVMAGAVGSNLSGNAVIGMALANIFADGFSMGVSSYESVITQEEDPLTKAFTTFLSFVLIGCLPIIVYYFYRSADEEMKMYATVIMAVLCLFVIGMIKGYTIDPTDNLLIVGSGIKTLTLGAIAGAISYYVAVYIKNNYDIQKIKE